MSLAVMVRFRGSSPRMRGAQCAGIHGVVQAEDHPRVCGEHEKNDEKQALDPGSSPRMRGAQAQAQGRFKAHRIIPAYAGSTSCAH